MTAYAKQESNATGLALAKEVSLGVVDGSAVWRSREPNSYKNFGGQYKLLARNPINNSRQARKGVITDLDAGGGWQEDLTFTSLQDIAEGLMFAAFRSKNELSIPAAANSTHAYSPAAGGAAYVAGTLLFAKGFARPANNGLKKVTSSTGTTVVVSDTGIQDETGASGIISRVGFEGASGDLTYSTAGPYPALLSTALNLTTLGLIPGEWVCIGDDASANQFATAGCNGFKRVLTVAAGKIEFDKSVRVGAATDAGTGKTIRIFYGRYIKNESDPSLIVRTTYQGERLLGKSDTTSADVQAEYIKGMVIDEVVVTFNTADKVTCEITTPGTQYETRTSVQGKKAGSRPTLNSGGAYNTSDELVHTALSICGQSTPLYAYLTDLAFTIKNNTKPNKALSVLGAFDVSAGQFTVNAAATGYFADVTAQQAIASNQSITVDAIVARDNQAIVFDLPLGTLGDGLLKVASNEPITLPLAIDGASNAILGAGSDYTFSMTFFDYVPAFVYS